MNVITSGLKKGGAKSTVLCYPSVQNPMTKCGENVKFLNPAENFNLALELAWSVQFQSFGRNRIPPWVWFDGGGQLESESVGLFHAKSAKELVFWAKCKNEALHGLIHEGQNSTKMQKVAEE